MVCIFSQGDGTRKDNECFMLTFSFRKLAMPAETIIIVIPPNHGRRLISKPTDTNRHLFALDGRSPKLIVLSGFRVVK